MRKREIKVKDKKGEMFLSIINPIIPYLEDMEVEDFQINQLGRVTLVKRGGVKDFIEDENITKSFVKSLIFAVAGMNDVKFTSKEQQVSEMLPISKFRFTGCVGNSIASGVEISIRLNDDFLYHTYKDFGLSNLEFNFLSNNVALNKSSIFVIGGTGSGKTTFSNLLIQDIPENNIIKVVGDIHDYIFKENQKYSELFTKEDKDYKDKFDLLTRINPDRILIPELKSGNVDLILRSLNSGHKGFMLTLHAGSEELGIAEAFKRNLAMSGKDGINLQEIQSSIDKNIDFLVYLSKDDKGKRYIEKLTINNAKYLQEAIELGIFGYANNVVKSKNYKPQKKRKNIPVLKVIKDFKGGMSRRKIAIKHTINRNTVNRIVKEVSM